MYVPIDPEAPAEGVLRLGEVPALSRIRCLPLRPVRVAGRILHGPQPAQQHVIRGRILAVILEHCPLKILRSDRVPRRVPLSDLVGERVAELG